jgi:hypothetical protein
MFFAFGGALLMGIAGVATAETQSEAQLKAELSAVQTRLAQLEAKQSNTWLSQRRTEEIKSLISDVLADADTRASLLEGGATAGHNGKHFYLASEDGGFLLEISGQLQFRHVTSFQNDHPEIDNDTDTEISLVDDETESGFVMRRAKVQFKGHIADPRIQYNIRFAVNSQDNSVTADKIVISYELMDDLTLWGGEDKAPFLREELTSSKYQTAVERSYVNEIFTADSVQGIGVTWEANENVIVNVAITDGVRSGSNSTTQDPLTQAGGLVPGSQFRVGEDFDPEDLGEGEGDFSRSSVSKDFNDDQTDFAITARVDVRLAGNWEQMTDFAAWEGEDMALFFGAAIHYEVGETGDSAQNNDFLRWTVDASLEMNNFNVYAAVVGNHTNLEDENDVIGEDRDTHGVVIQAGYMIIPNELEPFIRYEFIDLDDVYGNSYDEVTLLTFGVNRYFNKHNAKFTLDIVWALDSLPVAQEDLGLQVDDPSGEDQVTIRAQFQLLF